MHPSLPSALRAVAAALLIALAAAGCTVESATIENAESVSDSDIDNALPPTPGPHGDAASEAIEAAADPAEAPNLLGGRFVLANQLNEVLPTMLGPTDDLAATMRRMIAFPNYRAPEDAEITDILLTIYGDGFNTDPAQTRLFVEYTTGLAPNQAYDAAIRQLDEVGWVTDNGDNSASVEPDDASDIEYLVEVSSQGGGSLVKLSIISEDIDSAAMDHFSEWHDYETPLNVTTPVLITNIRAVLLDDTEVGTFYETGWSPFGSPEDMSEALTQELTADRWFYRESDEGWIITEPFDAEFEISTTLFTYARDFRLRR